jgi:ABC-type sugar transport system ATPase subunit
MITETTGIARIVPETASNQILAVRNLTKSFGATRALVDVSVAFLQGEIHCLLGENGAGKSTIGKIIGGLYAADEGGIFFQGRPVSFRSTREARACGIAVVYQELSLAPDLSVRANLRLGTEGARHPFAKLKHKQETDESVAVLRKLGLDIDVEQKVRDLPVALQQLIEISKALMQSPRLVIFDEPTAMLGAVEKRKLFDVLRVLRAEGTASVMITHHIEDVMEVGDRVSIMRNGKLVDSFPMDASIDGDIVLERLTGKKIQTTAVRRNTHGADNFLQIDHMVNRDGTPTSLMARRGEIVGLYGVVGCGADKIVHGLAGLGDARPLSFMIDGKPFKPRNTVQALAQGVSYLPSGRASNGIFATRSIRENLNLTQLTRLSKLGVVSKRAEREITGELLRRFMVKYGDAEHLITSLSGGNQQKVLLARAIARVEKILVLEEPTAGIDVDAKHEIHERIRELASKGVTVVLVSSDLIETITLCDTVFTMYGEKVMQKYADPQLDDQASIISDVLGQNANIQAVHTEALES